MPRVSVIMPVYNAAPFVEEAVQSVFAQGDAEVELIAIDDGSTDGSAGLLAGLARRFCGRMRVLSQANRGPYPARNLGLRHALGEYVAFLDADDYWAPSFLTKLLGALDAGAADVAYCGWQNLGPGAPGTQPFVPPRYEESDPVASFLRSCPWPIHAALTRKRTLDAVGGFSERRFSAMDYDLWIRILAVTRRLVLVPEVLAYYRWHERGQISKIKWRQTLDAWQVRRDFVRAHPELVAHLDARTIRRIVDGPLLAAGYNAYWKRDLDSAQRLFRASLARGLGGARDLRYLLPSLLPRSLYRAVIAAADRRATESVRR